MLTGFTTQTSAIVCLLCGGGDWSVRYVGEKSFAEDLKAKVAIFVALKRFFVNTKGY